MGRVSRIIAFGAFFAGALYGAYYILNKEGLVRVADLEPTSFEHRYDYKSYVEPLITDRSAFDALLSKYDTGNTFSSSENIDTLILLGVVEYTPHWLTSATLHEVDRLYPNLRKTKAGSITQHIGITSISYSINRTQSDEYDVALAPPVPAPLLYAAAAATVVTAIAIILRNKRNLSEQIESMMNATGRNDIAAASEQIAPAINIPRLSFAPQPATVGECTKDEENRLNDWYHEICRTGACAEAKHPIANLVIRDKLYACIAARTHAANMCFRGRFDDRHAKVMKELDDHVENCNFVITDQRSRQGLLAQWVDNVASSLIQTVR